MSITILLKLNILELIGLLQPLHPLNRGIVAHESAKYMQALQQPSLSLTHTRAHARSHRIHMRVHWNVAEIFTVCQTTIV